MKYESKENIHQVLTALTVKRLQAYSGLCKCYSELADIMVNEEGRAQVTASDIEQRYSSILSTVAYHDIDDFDIIAKQGNFSEKEVSIFKRFSNISKNFIDFTNGYNILRNSVSKDSDEVDQDVVSDYLDFMKNKAQNERTKNFVDYIDSHTPIIIGKNFYSMYTRAIQRIQEIDDTHVDIPSFNDTKTLPRKIFGGRGRLRLSTNPRYHSSASERDSSAKMIDYLEEDTEEIYPKHEKVKFRRKISPKEKIADMAYYSSKKINDAINSSTLPLKKLAITTGIGLLAGATLVSCLAKNESQLPATEAYEAGIELDISDSTAEDLILLGQEIDNAYNSPSIPTPEELRALLGHLDRTNTSVAEDLSETAFKRAHPEYSDVTATTTFQYVDTATPRDDKITFTYLDENGVEQTQVIKGLDGDFNISFNREDSFVTVMPEKIKELSDDSIPFETRTVLVKEFLGMCKDKYEALDKFAGMEPEIGSGLFGRYIEANRIDRTKIEEEQTTEQTGETQVTEQEKQDDDVIK